MPPIAPTPLDMLHMLQPDVNDTFLQVHQDWLVMSVDAEWGKNGEDEPNLWRDWKDSQDDYQDVPYDLFDDWDPEHENDGNGQTADDEVMIGDQRQMMTHLGLCGERVDDTDVDRDHRGTVQSSNKGSVGGLARKKQVFKGKSGNIC